MDHEISIVVFYLIPQDSIWIYSFVSGLPPLYQHCFTLPVNFAG